MIYLGADHRGFSLKEKIKFWLADWGYHYEDLGAATLDPKDDYTTYAKLVAEKIEEDKDNPFGILLCGSGVGVDVTANKFDGVRAAIGKEIEQVKAGRNDDNMNALVIASDFTNEEDAKEMIKVFLETKFSGEERFNKRLKDISNIEKNN